MRIFLAGADAIRADARRFHQLVGSDTAKGQTTGQAIIAGPDDDDGDGDGRIPEQPGHP
jgi:hypothetical protein